MGSPAASAEVNAFDEFGLPAESADNPFGLPAGAMDEFQLDPALAKMFDQGKK